MASDFPTYGNLAQATPTQPNGVVLPPERGSVLANIPRQPGARLHDVQDLAQRARQEGQEDGRDEGRQRPPPTNEVITAILSDPYHRTDTKKVEFHLDARRLKALTKPNLSGRRFEACPAGQCRPAVASSRR